MKNPPNTQNHCSICLKDCPSCICNTCKKDNFQNFQTTSCCLDHRHSCHNPFCGDYEPEEEQVKGHPEA